MIRAARMALACLRSAFGSPKSRNTLPTSLNQIDAALVHPINSLLNRPRRTFTKSMSDLGVLIAVFDFFWNAWITHNDPANSAT